MFIQRLFVQRLFVQRLFTPQVKQLGSGDVGMVDLVQLVGSDQRFALKSLEKREMLERNKVGRLRLLSGGGAACLAAC